MRLKRILISLAVVSFYAVAGTTWAATIELNNSLLNRSFENGVYNNNNGTVNCPVSWTCDNSAGVYGPGSAQYTPGLDGLPGNKSVPDGTQVANIPTGLAGAGYLLQITSTPLVLGNTYTFTEWYGLPAKEPDGTTPVTAWPSTVQVYLLEGTVAPAGSNGGFGVADSMCGGSACTNIIAGPTVGNWEQITLSWTPTQFTPGSNVGIQIFASTSNNNQAANFDFGTAVPEPTSLLLLGSGLVGFGVWGWKKGRA